MKNYCYENNETLVCHLLHGTVLPCNVQCEYREICLIRDNLPLDECVRSLLRIAGVF